MMAENTARRTLQWKDIIAWDEDKIFAYPEALLSTAKEKERLNLSKFCKRVVALVIDECRTVNMLWVLKVLSLNQSFRIEIKAFLTYYVLLLDVIWDWKKV